MTRTRARAAPLFRAAPRYVVFPIAITALSERRARPRVRARDFPAAGRPARGAARCSRDRTATYTDYRGEPGATATALGSRRARLYSSPSSSFIGSYERSMASASVVAIRSAFA